ncbi:MAG: LLM class flavin-dependent oxidoreductase [Acidobacteriota bacterium]
MPQFSIAFQTDKPLSAYGPLAAQAEELGFDGLSVYNDLLFQPAWPALLEMARHTRRVRLGPAAVNPFTCHPVNIAGHIALLDEASQGRAYLGLARGAWLDWLGLHPQKPVTALREAFECIRRLLSGEREPFEGKVFQLGGGESLRWEIRRAEIPFLLGSWGPKTIEACLDQVEEVKLGGTANPALLRRTLDWMKHIQLGRKSSGPVPGLVAGCVSLVDEDGPLARRLARREVALYLPLVADLDSSLQVDPELVRRIQEALNRRDAASAGRLVPDSLLDKLALAGTPHQVVEKSLRLLEAGAARIEFGTPHGLTPQQGLQLLGKKVLPALREWRSVR